MLTVVIVPVLWVKALPYNLRTNIPICILNIKSYVKIKSFVPVMYSIIIMAMGMYIILAHKRRGEHGLK